MQFAIYNDAAATQLYKVYTTYDTASGFTNYVGSSGTFNITISGKTHTVFRSARVGITPFVPEITGTVWILPDPSNDNKEFYTVSGTRITIRHTVSGDTGYVRIYTPSLYDGTEYITPFISYMYELMYRTYDRRTERPEVAFAYGDMQGRDTNTNIVIWSGKALVPLFRTRSTTTGVVSDWQTDGAMSANYLDISAYGTQPYKPTKNSRAGGKGVGTYHGRTNGERPDIAARNGVTTFGGSGNGLTYYQLGGVNALHQVVSYAYGLGEVRDNTYVRASLVAAYLLPTLTIRKSSATGVRIADRTYNSFTPPSSVDMLDIDHISDRKSCWYDFGELDGTGTFLDFTKTKFALFLPFVGTINLNPNSMQWRRLQIEYYIDAYNGNIVYWVYTQSVDSDTDELYGTYSGNCAIEIPLCGAGETGSMLGKITNMVSNLAVGAASIAAGNPVGAAGAAAGMIDSLTPTYYVDRSGAVDTNGTALDGWRISLKISMPHELRVDSSKLLGRPSFFRATIGSLPAGRHVCQGVDVEGIPNATAAEKQQIKMILEGGFYKV
jgi:hypothetical protein